MIEKAGDGVLLKLRSLYAHGKELADTEVKYVSVFPFSTLPWVFKDFTLGVYNFS